ncbi:hypothetical protein [Achromobacter sp. AGC39]
MNTEPRDTHIIAAGSPLEGFAYFGPFKDWQSADNSTIGNDDTWVIKLDNEGQKDSDVAGLDPNGTHIVVVMSLGGFSHYGPFGDADQAIDYAEGLEGDWSIAELQAAE